MAQVVELVVELAVLLVELLLLSALALDIDVHHADVFGESSHHAVVLPDLLLERHICPVHVSEASVELSHTVLHIAQLVSQLSVL